MDDGIQCVSYRGKEDLKRIREIIEGTLSEPYSVFTYHCFLYDYPHLCRTVGDSFPSLDPVIQ